MRIQVSGTDHRGNAVKIHANGWHARILQHETDHLCGKLYVDCMVCSSFAADYVRLQYAPTLIDVQNDGAKFVGDKLNNLIDSKQ